MFIRLSSTVPFHLSTPNSILFSLLASVFLLAVIRAALLFLRSRSSLSQEKRKLVGIQTENAEQEESQSSPSSPTSRGWACFKWDNLPTLPVSLKLNENDMKGQGVGFVAQQRSAAQPWRRTGPAFESPLPAMYQTDVPVSMAKMIMSRHTFRRPAPRPPPRASKPGSQMQYTRRPTFMV
ncbi:hypothetical protein Agabi119p4_8686 [Agaricus bisporus var. burnettii]|uniref:Uncharacterized protein n=1 Tax=Agaricus bisporus var. burnettii TaxID=192524 RepID=A0A8H7C4W4_AGABI|nr:hypothetical protein Agabi119p4_8686 [Agaricus bisporus var. burnettii]